MAETTSVLWTEQSLDDKDKAQARENILASKISYDNALADMTITKEVIRPWMNTKYEASVGDDNFLLLPSKFSDGMVVKHNDSLQTQSIPESGDVHYNLYKDYDCSYGGNTTKQDVIYLSEPAYNVRGFVSVMPKNGGASIMPLSAGQTDIYTYTGSWDKTSNNINNYGMPTDSYTFIPFAWTTDYPIVAIGIKGNGVVNKGHAFVETIK